MLHKSIKELRKKYAENMSCVFLPVIHNRDYGDPLLADAGLVPLRIARARITFPERTT